LIEFIQFTKLILLFNLINYSTKLTESTPSLQRKTVSDYVNQLQRAQKYVYLLNEYHIDGHTPVIEYIKAKEKIFLTHTEVPKELNGKGIGSAIVKAVLEDIERQDLTLVPLCPFVAGYIKRHPEWKKLVLKNINIE